MGMEGLDQVVAEVIEEAARRIRRWLISAAILIALCLAMIALLSVRPANASEPTPCAPLQPLLDHLVKAFHEFVVMTGNAAGDRHVIVTMSDAGTFSIVVTDGKQACIIMAGDKAALDNGI
jgi:hypothetical protein